MWKSIWLILLAGSAAAQVDRDTFFRLLEQGETERARTLIQEKCLGFRPTKEDLNRLGYKPDIILAMLQCLYGDRPESSPLEPTAEKDPPPSVHILPKQPEKPEPRPLPRAVTRPAADGSAVLHSLRNLIGLVQVGVVANRLEARALVARTLSEDQGWTPEQIRNEISEQNTAPWIWPLLEDAYQARGSGYPTLSFDVANRTDYYASIDERGIQVFMSLFLLTGPPKDGEPVNLAEELLVSHESFPIIYEPESQSFTMHQLENTDITRMRMARILNPMKPLVLLPGHWGVEIKAVNGMDRLKSHEKYYFKVEPGKNYSLGIEWENKKGIKRLVFELNEKPK